VHGRSRKKEKAAQSFSKGDPEGADFGREEFHMTEAASMLQFWAMPLMMIFICALNLVVTHRRAENRSSLDGTRLEAALVEELRLLARLYQSNLVLLEQEEMRLVSTRIPLAVFRANVGRITLLDEVSIKQMVAVYANNEHIEMMVAERAKSIKNGQCTIYVFDKGDNSAVDTFRELFSQALASVESVIQNIEARRASSGLSVAMRAFCDKTMLVGNVGRSPGFTDI
jgi:hypothetical protein